MAQILIDKLLQACVKQGASDIHIVVGQPPVFRLHGRMRKLETKVLEADDAVGAEVVRDRVALPLGREERALDKPVEQFVRIQFPALF